MSDWMQRPGGDNHPVHVSAEELIRIRDLIAAAAPGDALPPVEPFRWKPVVRAPAVDGAEATRVGRSTITAALAQVVRQFLQEGHATPARINNGSCFRFAAEAAQAVPALVQLETPDPDDEATSPSAELAAETHAFLHAPWLGLYFDATATGGVSRIEDLPTFRQNEWARRIVAAGIALRPLGARDTPAPSARAPRRRVAPTGFDP